MELFGRRYIISEPRGRDATRLYATAIGVVEESGASGALDALEPEPETEPQRGEVIARNGARLRSAARLIAAHRGGDASARATLHHVAVAREDGREVAAVSEWDALYSEPGHFLEPYLVAVICWLRWGFLFDGAASRVVEK